MKGPNNSGKQHRWPFQARGIYCRPQMPKAKKVFGFVFHLPGVYVPIGIDSQNLMLRFHHFLLVKTQNSEDQEKSTNSCDDVGPETRHGGLWWA